LRTQLAGDRAEYARADRFPRGVDQDRRIAVEPDRSPVRAADLLRRTHDDRLVDVALADTPARDSFLDRHHDHVADRSRLPPCAAEHTDALHPTRARVVGNFQVRLYLNHDPTSMRGRLAAVRQHFPTLGLRMRPTLLNADRVADLAAVIGVVRGVLLRPADELLVERMHHAAF